MGTSQRLTAAIRALANAGIPTERGYPNRRIRVSNQTVAAVTVERTDSKETVLAVWICGSVAAACEDVAETAAHVLRQEMAFCQVEDCRFDHQSGLFSVKILALWKECLASTISCNGKQLTYATLFSAERTCQIRRMTDEATGENRVEKEEAFWTLTVQEQLPLGVATEAGEQNAFALTVAHGGYEETFPACHWISVILEENDAGFLRRRTARSWAERIVKFSEE